jgi:catechol 2,3-dioxygenase-like lactoylglutathione lyase family enzyme
MIRQISHISLKTHSINNVINFYIKILGFKISHKFINKKKEIYGLFIYCGNRTLLEFFLNNTKKKINSPIEHICFEVKKIRQLAKKLKKFDKNIKVKRGKTDYVLQFMTQDFDKNLIEFHEFDKKSKLKF